MEAFPFPEQDSPLKKLGKILLSAFLSSLFGGLVAEVVANSLVEISISAVFAIVYGVAFFVLGVAVLYRILTSDADNDKRVIMIVFTSLVFVSSVCSILLERDWVPLTSVAKVPMYAVVGLSLSFAITFLFTEFINTGVCDRCCRTDFESNPIIGSNKQVYLIFAGSIIIGSILGVLFGVIDVEHDDEMHAKFDENLIVSLPLGAFLGAVVGGINQVIRANVENSFTTAKWNIQSDLNTDI